MRLRPVTANLSVVLDFGLTEEEYIETCRTRAGLVYVSTDGGLHRGADHVRPTQTWFWSAKTWAPYRGGPLAPTCNGSVIPEPHAERIMWPEFYRSR